MGKFTKHKKRFSYPAVSVPNAAGTLEYWDNIQWQTFASQSYVNAVAVTSVSGVANQINVSGTLTPVISLAPNAIFPGVEGLTLPIGTSAQRPWAFFGMIRANSSTGRIEVGDGMFWNSINTSNASVSSIGITAGTGISVSGSPVTSSGNIFVGLSNTGVTSGNYTYISSLTTNSQGQITAISSGSSPTGGTVTSITAGTGLSGGTITTSGTISLADNPVLPGNASLTLPIGNSAQRPSFPFFGMIRGNSLTSRYEVYDGSAWQTINLTNATVSLVGISVSTGMTVGGSPVVGSGTISVGLNAELQALSGLNTTGLVARTGSASYAPRTLTAGTGISITNGNGLAGNPTLSVSSIDINSATTGQLNISRLNGYPTSSSSFLSGDGTWGKVDLGTDVMGSLPINKLAGYPGTTTTFLRGDGTWVAPVLSSLSGSLNATQISGYPTDSSKFLNGAGSWTTVKINTIGCTGNVSLATFNLTTSGTISATTGTLIGDHLDSYSAAMIVQCSMNFSGNSLADVQSITLNELHARFNSEINVYNEMYIQASKTPVLGFSYGYLNSDGHVGTASGANPYSLRCTERVAASEFNATSSQKIKRVSKEPMDIEDLRQKFLKIPFKSYQYLDPSTGQGDHYGIIAEELAQYFPQFVETQHKQFVPNCLKLMTLTKIEGLTYFFAHDFEMDAIDPKSQKIKIVMGDTQVDTTIVTLTKETLQVVIEKKDAERVKAEHHKNHYFAYGTYEKCPTVSKNKLFEVGLILLQDVLRKSKISTSSYKD